MSEDRFLSRWSRMKAKSRSGVKTPQADVGEASKPVLAAATAPAGEVEDTEAPAKPVQAPAIEASTDAREIDEEAVLADWPEDLPRPDDLTEDSDFSAFFSPDVSETVRTVALRRLWRTSPMLANLDGLLDYGEDFTDAGRVLADMQSAYRAGKGYFQPENESETADEGNRPEVERGDAEEIAAAHDEDADDPDPDIEEEGLA